MNTGLNAAALPGLAELGPSDPRICVAVLDGPIDYHHPALREANVKRHATLVDDRPSPGSRMSTHGTHVCSVIFGRPAGGVLGLARECRGISFPIFSDTRARVPQLDLARAIEQAVEAGAHVINISGGERVDDGQASLALERAIAFCKKAGVLVVAAAGNDGCPCVHVPAAIPGVLVVGGLGSNGRPLNNSNWGDSYKQHGILAPGERVLGARAGGGTIALTGSSFATAIVSGVAALLLSAQVRRGLRPDAIAVRKALLATAGQCAPTSSAACDRYLGGVLNIAGAHSYLFRSQKGVSSMSDSTISDVSSNAAPSETTTTVVPSGSLSVGTMTQVHNTAPPSNNGLGIVPSCGCDNDPSDGKGLVYVIGNLRYDFGTEARRDAFTQLMPRPTVGNASLQPNPYDVTQMVSYLYNNPSESTKLIWTLCLDSTPIYALEAEVPYSREVYDQLVAFLDQQLPIEQQVKLGDSYDPLKNGLQITRVSIPGRIQNRTMRLFSGQVVPVVRVTHRGLFGWNEDTVEAGALDAIDTYRTKVGLAAMTPGDKDKAKGLLGNIFTRIYYETSNLGQTSSDRALNFAATNAFQAATVVGEVIASGVFTDPQGNAVVPQIASIRTEKSRYCRMDSDCWDVRLSFFNPKNVYDSWYVFRFTLDVSDEYVVTVGKTRSWLSSPSATDD